MLYLYKVSMSYLNTRITSRWILPNILIKETQVDESKDAYLEKLDVSEHSQLQRLRGKKVDTETRTSYRARKIDSI